MHATQTGAERTTLLGSSSGDSGVCVCVGVHVCVWCACAYRGHRSISGADPQLKISFKIPEEPGDYLSLALHFPEGWPFCLSAILTAPS